MIKKTAQLIEEWAQQNKNDISIEIQLSPLVNDKLAYQRYSIARKGDLNAALSMYQGSLEWRKTACTGKYSCPPCEKDSTAHCFFPIGTDVYGNPVIYGNPPRASQTNVEETVRHVVHQLEYCWNSASNPQGGAECTGRQWVWVVDFNGFGLKHAMNARLGISFASTFAAHFPERLRTLILINPPSVFSLLLTALTPFADHRTLSKVQTINGNSSTVITKLQEYGLNVKDKEGIDKNCRCVCGSPELDKDNNVSSVVSSSSSSAVVPIITMNSSSSSSSSSNETVIPPSNPCICTCPNTMLNWLQKVLDMNSEPGNIPPLPPSTQSMQLPNINFKYDIPPPIVALK